MKRILLVAGGTGGHVYPLIAVTEELKKFCSQKGEQLELHAITDGALWAGEFAKEGVTAKIILAGKWRAYTSIKNFLDIFRGTAGFFQALYYLYWLMPDVVMTKGGSVALPVAFAARWYFIPIFTHESDTIPGRANRIIGKLAKKVFLSFDEAASYFSSQKVVVSGNPIRKELSNGSKDRAREMFRLSADRKVVLVIGGSQGAQRINTFILDSLVELTKEFQIIHQTGENNLAEVEKTANQIITEGQRSYGQTAGRDYRTVAFLDSQNMADVLACADVVVTRAGASLLFEIAAVGKPMIVIPLSDSASGHQLRNAKAFEKYGAVVIEEANVASHILLSQLRHLVQPDIAQGIAEHLRQMAKLDAAEKIAEQLLST